VLGRPFGRLIDCLTVKSFHGKEEKMKKVTKDFLENNLPEGSGFDSKWTISEKSGIYTCKSEYHCLNERGFYDGFLPFVVIIDSRNPIDFKLHFISRDIPYVRSLVKRYGDLLREYIEQEIADLLV
jgi:hypothetical protein